MMLGDAPDHNDFPDIRFNQNTTNNIVVAGHTGYLLNGTFMDPTTDELLNIIYLPKKAPYLNPNERKVNQQIKSNIYAIDSMII
jgi:hypothetical protein